MGVPLLDLMKEDSEYDRTFKRYRVNLAVSVAPTAAEGTVDMVPGLAHNVSLSGIGFVCSVNFALASLLDVEISLNGETFLLLARVRWRRPLDVPGDPMYLYGTKFERTEAVLGFIPVAAQFLLARGTVRRQESIVKPSAREADLVPAG